MENTRIVQPGEIYQHFKDKLYQIITVAIDSETREQMVVYQALYGDFKTYVRPLAMFVSEVDHEKYPMVTQKYRFELRRRLSGERIESDLEDETLPEKITINTSQAVENTSSVEVTDTPLESTNPVNAILLKFLDAPSYTKKLEVISSNGKHLTDRLINDMAVSLDCAVDDGPIEERIRGLTHCLKAMCRFEDRRVR